MTKSELGPIHKSDCVEKGTKSYAHSLGVRLVERMSTGWAHQRALQTASMYLLGRKVGAPGLDFVLYFLRGTCPLLTRSAKIHEDSPSACDVCSVNLLYLTRMGWMMEADKTTGISTIRCPRQKELMNRSCERGKKSITSFSTMSGEKPATTRKDRKTGSMHVGDEDFDINDPAYEMDATWGDVCKACCVRSPVEWGLVFIGILLVVFFLYFFLLGLDLLGDGAKTMGGCAAGALFGDDMNPIAGLMVGIVATVLLQSSSTTTSIVVSLVGAGTVSVNQGIFMIMGANIGTSVTNTIVAMGHLGDGDQLERAFAGATVHDMFNFLSVACLLPIEAATGYLNHLTKACVSNFESQEGEKWEGPVKKLVEPLAKKIINVNGDVAKEIAKGEKTCNDYYPIDGKLNCTDPSDPLTCQSGLLSCDKKADPPFCPAFFDSQATESVDRTAGVCAFVIGLIILFICLFGLVKILQRMMMGASTRVLYKATNINGYAAMIIGAGITMLVQSSSITTSVLTPLKNAGMTALGIVVVILLAVGLMWTFYHCKYRGGREKCVDFLVTRERQSNAVRDLPDDMEWLKAKIHELSEHTGLPVEDEEAVGKEGGSDETEGKEGSSSDEEAPAKTG
eukprot:scaffold11698_cov138-Cylindrotheca_fusiformis.AAC.9